MLITEKKLRSIIKKLILENIVDIDPDSIRAPAPFPGEDSLPRSRKFFGHSVLKISDDAPLKRRELLSYAHQFKNEFLKAAQGIPLEDDEQKRLDEFGRNVIGFLIGLKKDSERGKDKKYSVTKDVEFLGSIRRSFNEMLEKNLKVNKKKFFDIIMNDDIRLELLNLNKEDIPQGLQLYLQQDPDFITLDIYEILGLENRPAKSTKIEKQRKNLSIELADDSDVNLRDIKHHYESGDIDQTILAITKRIRHILSLDAGLFGRARWSLYWDLCVLLGLDSDDKVDEWLKSNGFNSRLLKDFKTKTTKIYTAKEA